MAEAMAVVAEEGEQDGKRQGRRRRNFQKLASEFETQPDVGQKRMRLLSLTFPALGPKQKVTITL